MWNLIVILKSSLVVKAPKKRAVKLNRSSLMSFEFVLHKGVAADPCSTNTFAPLLDDVDTVLEKDLVVQCPKDVELLVVGDSVSTPASCSSNAAESDHLAALSLDSDHELPCAASGDPVVQSHFVGNKFINPTPSSVVSCQSNSSGNQVMAENVSSSEHAPGSALGMSSGIGFLEVQTQPVDDVPCGDHFREWRQVSSVKALRCGIPADSFGSPGTVDAPFPHSPVTDEDRMVALGAAISLVEGVGPNLRSSFSSVHSSPQVGDQSQCSYSEQLSSQMDAASGICAVNNAAIPLSSGCDSLVDGLKLKSILKKPKGTKQKRSPPS